MFSFLTQVSLSSTTYHQGLLFKRLRQAWFARRHAFKLKRLQSAWNILRRGSLTSCTHQIFRFLQPLKCCAKRT